MTLSDSIDDELRTGIDIAADIDIGIGCLIGELIGDRIIAVPECDLCAFKEVALFDGLTDGEDDSVCVDFDGVILIVCRRELLVFIKDTCALLHDNAFDMTVFID